MMWTNGFHKFVLTGVLKMYQFVKPWSGPQEKEGEVSFRVLQHIIKGLLCYLWYGNVWATVS